MDDVELAVYKSTRNNVITRGIGDHWATLVHLGRPPSLQ